MSGRGMAQKNLELIEHSRNILAEIQPTTVRGVAYQLFTRGLIENMGQKCVRNVSRMLVIARERGSIPWSWIVDDTRSEKYFPKWNGLEDFGERVVSQYRKDFWQRQDSWIKVFSEKGTIIGIVQPVLAEFAVNYKILHGFGSATSLHDVAQESLTDDRYLEILYIGDFDPSGMHMSEADLPARIKNYGGAVAITRIALTREDCGGLPSFDVETKGRDPRYAWFKRAHGNRCWELDAMNPNDLRQRLRDEIIQRIDVDAWVHCQAVEDAERESLNRYVSAWGGHEHF
jgi:hypothetical protein